MNYKAAIIVFSGYNFRAIIAFLRFASRNKIPYFIIARDQEDPVYLTDYKESVIFQRHDHELNCQLFYSIKNILSKEAFDQYYLLPSSEVLNRFILEKRDLLLEIGFSFPVTTRDIYLHISEKDNFSTLCKDFGIRVPESLSPEITNLPLVAKPKKYFSERKQKFISPELIFTSVELRQFLEREYKEDYIFQEFVFGKSFYLLFYFSTDKKVSSFAQENLIQQPNGKSIIAARYSDLYKTPIAEKFKDLFFEIGFQGLVMVEVKEYNNQYYMIEANPRLWGPSQFFLDSGSEIFNSFVADMGFVCEAPEKEYPDKLYFWCGGFNGNNADVTLHGYDEKDFLKQFSELLQNDVYLRSDTIRLFNKEIKNG